MRVLFDGFWWVHGPSANRTVMREFVLAWSRAYPDDEIIIAVRAKHIAEADIPVGVRVVTTRLAPQAMSNAVELPLLARRHRVDAMVVHNYTPLFGRSAVFVHDLLFEDHPEWFSLKERLYFAPMALLARRAAAVTTSSETEAARMMRLHPKLAPVIPIGLAAAPHLSNATATRPQLLGEIGGFVLSVGRLNIRKNLAVAIEGAMRAQTTTPDRPLVIVGSAEFSGAAATLPVSVADYVADGRLRFLGRITDGELRWMYENADCLIFLSRDEGFGLPPVEGLHFGTPVLVSDIPVMREVVGVRGTFVSPDSAEDVAEALDSVIADAPVRRPNDSASVKQRWEQIVSTLRDSLATLPKKELTR